jgi:hypothetical protein
MVSDWLNYSVEWNISLYGTNGYCYYFLKLRLKGLKIYENPAMTNPGNNCECKRQPDAIHELSTPESRAEHETCNYFFEGFGVPA